MERPGEPNDREHIISNIDNDRWGIDLEKYRDNYDKINWGSEDKDSPKYAIPWGCWKIYGIFDPITIWVANHKLDMSPQEQRRLNIKNGFLKE